MYTVTARDSAHAFHGFVGSYLDVTVHGNPADPRTDDITGDVMANGEVDASWGLHLVGSRSATSSTSSGSRARRTSRTVRDRR